jgi:hypothetical protein
MKAVHSFIFTILFVSVALALKTPHDMLSNKHKSLWKSLDPFFSLGNFNGTNEFWQLITSMHRWGGSFKLWQHKLH